MRPGDLVLVRGTSIISDVEKSPYIHVAVIISETQVIEAVPWHGVQYNDLAVYRGQDIFTHPGLTAAQRIGIEAWARAHVGDKYDYGLLAWEFVRYEAHIKLPWWVTPDHFICSTFAVDDYRANKADLWPHIKYPAPPDVPIPMVDAGMVQ